MALKPKTRIAHLAGPTATIQNIPPLVTSNKARLKYSLPPRKNPDGTVPTFDALRAQRLAAPAKVYVERFSAHPLEADAAELYGPPDGYIGADGTSAKPALPIATNQYTRSSYIRTMASIRCPIWRSKLTVIRGTRNARARARHQLRRGMAIYPIELDADDIDPLQQDLGHRPDVSLWKLDPLVPTKHLRLAGAIACRRRSRCCR